MHSITSLDSKITIPWYHPSTTLPSPSDSMSQCRISISLSIIIRSSLIAGLRTNWWLQFLMAISGTFVLHLFTKIDYISSNLATSKIWAQWAVASRFNWQLAFILLRNNIVHQKRCSSKNSTPFSDHGWWRLAHIQILVWLEFLSRLYLVLVLLFS